MTRPRDPVADAMNARIRAGAMPSAAWWVGGPEGPISRGAAPDPGGIDTPFDLASLTKPLVTAPLAVLLERERKLSLAAPLATVFPELRETAFASATLRDAATHVTGLPAWAPLYLSGQTREDYVQAIASSAPAAARGVTLYSDLGYLLLGFAVERAGGAALDRLFEERVARPLGLGRCGFPGRSDRFRDAAPTERGNAYERRLAGEDAPPERFRTELIRGTVHDGNAWGLGGVAGHAGLFGTADAVARIALALLEPPRLARPRGSFDAMFLREPPEAPRTLGFLTAAATESVRGVLADDAVGHFGFTGTSVWIERSRGRVYVLLTNRVHPAVPEADFVETRRAFHEAAVAAAHG